MGHALHTCLSVCLGFSYCQYLFVCVCLKENFVRSHFSFFHSFSPFLSTIIKWGTRIASSLCWQLSLFHHRCVRCVYDKLTNPFCLRYLITPFILPANGKGNSQQVGKKILLLAHFSSRRRIFNHFFSFSMSINSVILQIRPSLTSYLRLHFFPLSFLSFLFCLLIK